ncbi:MAG: MotA/TolQ/ExbB proton channel family protein [bacterium]
MKRVLFALAVLTVVWAGFAAAQDVREAARKAEADRAEALKRAKAIENKILNDRNALIAEVERLEAEHKQLEADVSGLEKKIIRDQARLEDLNDKWSEHELEFKEVSGNVRVVARDLETILQQSQISALVPGRMERIQPLLETGYFPDIDDIAGMADVFFDEIRRSGQVSLVQAHYVGRDGEDRPGEVLTLGKFTAMYRDGDEVGFLTYKPDGQRFFALSELPPRGLRRAIGKYLAGTSAEVPFDISGGTALRQITHKQSLGEHLKAGGIIVWPIGLIALAALFIIVHKIVFLNRVRRTTGKYMAQVNEFASRGDWESCEAVVNRHEGEHSPVNHVIEAGLNARDEDRETLESVLQEAILRELPRVERGLSVLAIFGAVAPLLGLLGTVTGMIDTFRVITLFGTGDPKLMSGGISEALVTTELGLAVAIPIMLMHTFLSRRVDAIIGEMEEKAVGLTNIIQKERRRNGVHGGSPERSFDEVPDGVIA